MIGIDHYWSALESIAHFWLVFISFGHVILFLVKQTELNKICFSHFVALIFDLWPWRVFVCTVSVCDIKSREAIQLHKQNISGEALHLHFEQFTKPSQIAKSSPFDLSTMTSQTGWSIKFQQCEISSQTQFSSPKFCQSKMPSNTHPVLMQTYSLFQAI